MRGSLRSVGVVNEPAASSHVTGMLRVFRPISGRIQVHLPHTEGAKAWLRGVIGPRSPILWTGGCWTVAPRHYERVVAAGAARYGVAMAEEEYSRTSFCTGSCQGASKKSLRKCACICGSDGHGGGGGQNGWRPVGDDLVVSSERFVRRYIVRL